jgi:uncharacterized membrane protein
MQLFIAASLLLGIGLGGFFDGILFHQILQTHQMFSNIIIPNTLVNVEINMFWDGMFHTFTWITTVIGLGLLIKAMRVQAVLPKNGYLIGFMLIGAGFFNIVEGTLDHLLLQVHHVIQNTTPYYQLVSDITFLVSGIVLLICGLISVSKNKGQILAI